MENKKDNTQIVNNITIININSNNISKNNKVLESANPSTKKNKRWNSIKDAISCEKNLELLLTLIFNMLIVILKLMQR